MLIFLNWLFQDFLVGWRVHATSIIATTLRLPLVAATCSYRLVFANRIPGICTTCFDYFVVVWLITCWFPHAWTDWLLLVQWQAVASGVEVLFLLVPGLGFVIYFGMLRRLRILLFLLPTWKCIIALFIQIDKSIGISRVVPYITTSIIIIIDIVIVTGIVVVQSWYFDLWNATRPRLYFEVSGCNFLKQEVFTTVFGYQRQFSVRSVLVVRKLRFRLSSSFRSQNIL